MVTTTAKVFKPLHPAFTGKASLTAKTTGSVYEIDLDRGICSCESGQPFYVDVRGKVQENGYCAHKLKFIAKKTAKDYDNLIWPYIQALASRYIVYDVVSAFHKELRRGDFEQAYYWGCMLIKFRGRKGVISYMINIIYEETRDHKLLNDLLAAYSLKDIGMDVLAAMISRFCKSKKKWELPHRLPIFLAEMEAYRTLADTYGYDVAKGRDIIAKEAADDLLLNLQAGFKNKDLVQVQIGLKGLFKSKSPDHDAHKVKLFNTLRQCMQGKIVNNFDYNKNQARMLENLLDSRDSIVGGYGYHEINAFADILCGEPASFKTLASRALVDADLVIPKFVLGETKSVPMYAHDNHTWTGKAKMKAYPGQLEPGAKQSNIDFRWCGAYFGVAWRHLAFKQFKTCEVPWGKVSWNEPKWLYPHIRRMFY